MARDTTKKSTPHTKPRQIIGISLDPPTAREVKAYAGKHGLSLKKPFEEMWQSYKKRDSGAKS
jgi:hypothetical protein